MGFRSVITGRWTTRRNSAFRNSPNCRVFLFFRGWVASHRVKKFRRTCRTRIRVKSFASHNKPSWVVGCMGCVDIAQIVWYCKNVEEDWDTTTKALFRLLLSYSSCNDQEKTYWTLSSETDIGPTNYSTDTYKDEFYDELVSLIWNTTGSDVMMVAGDFNAPDKKQCIGSLFKWSLRLACLANR